MAKIDVSGNKLVELPKIDQCIEECDCSYNDTALQSAQN